MLLSLHRVMFVFFSQRWKLAEHLVDWRHWLAPGGDVMTWNTAESDAPGRYEVKTFETIFWSHHQGVWTWMSGAPWSYDHWGEGEPNQVGQIIMEKKNLCCSKIVQSQITVWNLLEKIHSLWLIWSLSPEWQRGLSCYWPSEYQLWGET